MARGQWAISSEGQVGLRRLLMSSFLLYSQCLALRWLKRNVRASNLCPFWGRPLWADILLIIITFICNWTLIHLVVWATEGRHRLESYVCNWRNLRLACICGEIKNKMRLIWKMPGLELAVSWPVTHGTLSEMTRTEKWDRGTDWATLPARLLGACHNL